MSRATLKAKLGVERRPYRIVGACNPPLAHRAIEADPDIGLLLPCNVVVREEDGGKTSVGFMDPKAVLKLVNKPEVHALGKEGARQARAGARQLSAVSQKFVVRRRLTPTGRGAVSPKVAPAWK